jgi:hypothetical protein
MRHDPTHPPAVSQRIQPTKLGMVCLVIFAIVYVALCVHMALTLGVFSVKMLFFGAVCASLWLLCARALLRQHVGQLSCKNNAWSWEPSVAAGALTHHPVLDVMLAARFDWQTGMLLRFALYETDEEGDILGTTVLWMVALRRHAANAAAWQDLRRAVYASALSSVFSTVPSPVSSAAGRTARSSEAAVA